MEWLPKDQARRVYRIAQEMEETMVEQRRNRAMEETRAGATNITMNAQTAPVTESTSSDPMAKLGQLKQMLEAGLINEDEFTRKKADILSQM